MIHDPATKNAYFDRTEITATIKKRIEAFHRGYRQNIALIGTPYIGKSSIIRHVFHNISDARIIPLYLEVVSEPFEYFVKKFMITILQSYMASQGLIVPATFDKIVKKARKYLPKTMKHMRLVRQLIDAGNKKRAFDELMTLSAIMAEEKGKKVILILDEFDHIQCFGIPEAFETFSRHIMVQKNTMYMVTSSRPELANQIFREKLSLLFGNFETVKVLPFSFKESLSFINTRLNKKEMHQSLSNVLIRLTDGHPFYLSCIMNDMSMRGTSNGQMMSDEMVVESLTHLLFRSCGSLHQHFILSLSPFNKGNSFGLYLNILLAIACGRKKLHIIARTVERDKDEVKKVLQRLLDEGHIERAGYFYYITDSLLRFWLKYVFQKKYVSSNRSPDENEILFRDDIFDLIDSAYHEEKKELSKRVEELLRTFHNDVVEVEGKRFKCPSFSEVYLRPTNGRVYPLYAKGHNTRWLCQVATRPVEEEDIQVLIADSKKLRKRANKRLLITPFGISLDAKLMAKQAKVDIWNLRNLNFVFDLFDKPKIIIDADMPPRSLSEESMHDPIVSPDVESLQLT